MPLLRSYKAEFEQTFPVTSFGLSADGQPGQYWLCPGLKAFFAHAQPILARVMALSAEGKKPPEIMAALGEDLPG